MFLFVCSSALCFRTSSTARTNPAGRVSKANLDTTRCITNYMACLEAIVVGNTINVKRNFKRWSRLLQWRDLALISLFALANKPFFRYFNGPAGELEEQRKKEKACEGCTFGTVLVAATLFAAVGVSAYGRR